MLRLPVSGLEVELRVPDGHDDVLLAESPIGASLALALVGRLIVRGDGTPVDAGRLSVADLEFVLVALRRALLGDRLAGELRCPVASCGGRLDVSFGLAEYVAYRRPRRPPSLLDLPEPGWFTEPGQAGSYRLPDGDDLVAIAGAADPVGVLASRCLRAAGGGRATGPWRRRAEAAMEALAPTLSGSFPGTCPECRTAITLRFDVIPFVLAELRAHASWVYDDVHRIAGRYGWPEDEILALPRPRRARYAELIRDEAA